MSPHRIVRTASSLAGRPPGAIALSFVTVLALTALLGIWFFPHELFPRPGGGRIIMRRLHSLRGDPRVVLLAGLCDDRNRTYLSRQVAIFDPAREDSPRVVVPTSLEPLVIAVSKTSHCLFVGTCDGRLLAIDFKDPRSQPTLIGRFDGKYSSVLGSSADGETLVCGGDSGLAAWNVAERSVRWSRPDLKLDCWTIAPHAPLVLGESAGGLVEIDLFTGRTLRLIGRYEWPSSALVVSPDGQRIVRLDMGGRLTLIDRATGESAWPNADRPRLASPAKGAVAISPCGRFLVTGDSDGLCNLVIWNLEQGTKLGILAGHEAPVTGVEFDDDGRWYSWGPDGPVRTWGPLGEHALSSTPRLEEPLANNGQVQDLSNWSLGAATTFSLRHP